MKDEIYFLKREEFWLAKRKGDIYTYESAKLLTDPFKDPARKLLNIFGLVLEYKEADATVSVVDLEPLINGYTSSMGCPFGMQDLKEILGQSQHMQYMRGIEMVIDKASKFKSLSGECQKQLRLLVIK